MSKYAGARASKPSALERSDDIGDDLISLAERRIALIQHALGLPDSYFGDRQAADLAASCPPAFVPDPEILTSDAGVRLIGHFRRIEDPAVRNGILELLFSLPDLSSSFGR